MQVDTGDNQDGDSGSDEGTAAGRRSFGELLGAPKSNASLGASQGKGATVNPGRGSKWTAERRAKVAATWRKRKAETAGSEDTSETILEVKAEPEPKAPAAKPSKEDLEGWAGLIYLGHVLAAGMLRIPELQLDKQTAAELSAASMNVMRHYSSAILSEKTQDWIKLAMVAGAVYIPRVAAAKERATAARLAKKAPVVDMGFQRPPAPPEVEIVMPPSAAGDFDQAVMSPE